MRAYLASGTTDCSVRRRNLKRCIEEEKRRKRVTKDREGGCAARTLKYKSDAFTAVRLSDGCKLLGLPSSLARTPPTPNKLARQTETLPCTAAAGTSDIIARHSEV